MVTERVLLARISYFPKMHRKKSISPKRYPVYYLHCIIALVCLFTITNKCYPQTKRWKPDSVQALLRDTTNLTPDQRGQLFVQTGLQKHDRNAIPFYDHALSVLKDSSLIVEASYLKGVSLFMIGEYAKVEDTILPILDYAERAGLHWYVNGCYDLLGMSYGMTGHYNLAIKYQQKSVVKAEMFPARLGREYTNLGLLYYKMRDNQKAIASYKKGLEHMRSTEGWPLFGKEIPTVLTNIGLCYCEMDSLHSALVFLEEADRACGEQCDKRKKMHLEFGKGMVKIKLRQYKIAKEHLTFVLKTARRINESRMEAESLMYLARVYLATSVTDSAVMAITNAEAIALRNDLNEILLDSYRQSIELFTKSRDYKKLAGSQQKFIQQKATLYGADLARDLALVEIEVEERLNRQELARQQKRVDVQKKVMSYQKHNARLWGLLLVLLLLLGLGVAFRMIQRIKIQRVLDRKIQERRAELVRRETHISFTCRKLLLLEKRLRQELESLPLSDHVRIS